MREINVNRGRKLSMENAKLIGSGAASNVYMIAEDTVVKVLKKGSMQDAEREIMLSKWALKKGIPTAISYDVVDVDGHPGLVYESLGRGNLRNLIRDCPEKFDDTMRRYAELLHTINSVVVEENQLPNAWEAYAKALDFLRGTITEAEYGRMRALLETIPPSMKLVHGDCQMKNVRVVGNEFLLIDLDTLSCGDAIFELAGLYCCYKAYQEPATSDFDSFFEMPVETEKKMLDSVFELYFEGVSDEARQVNVKKTALLSYMYMSSLGKRGELSDVAAETMLQNFREYLYQVDDLKLTY